MKPLTLFAAILPALPAQAEGLMGREVTVHVETTIAGDTTTVEEPVNRAYVDRGVEFALGGTLGEQGLWIVPVFVDVGARYIEMIYSVAEPGAFLEAEFNGYVFTFDPGCAELKGASISAEGTTLAITDDALSVTTQELRLNVSGMDYADGDSVLISLNIGDCVAA